MSSTESVGDRSRDHDLDRRNIVTDVTSRMRGSLETGSAGEECGLVSEEYGLVAEECLFDDGSGRRKEGHPPHPFVSTAAPREWGTEREA